MKFQGAGKAWLAPRTDLGAPGVFFFVGCADVLNLGLALDSFDHIERCSGNNAVDYHGVKKKTMNLTLEITEHNPKNKKLALNGTEVEAGGSPATVTDEEFPADLVAGDVVMLGGATPRDEIESLTITDSASPPTTVNTADYALLAKEYGMVQIKNIGTYVQPFKASYSYENKAYVSIFTAGVEQHWLRYNYLNVANQSRKGLVDLYNCRIDPTDNLELINDEIQKLSLKGSVLIDLDKPDDGPLGQFGRVGLV